jgi:hypothetical protein
MAKAMIYRPAKTAMQSGRAKTQNWILRFQPEEPYFVDNLMGWVGMTDMPQEIQLTFPTKEAAIEYATEQSIPFDIIEPHVRTYRPKAYADNFKFERPEG